MNRGITAVRGWPEPTCSESELSSFSAVSCEILRDSMMLAAVSSRSVRHGTI